MYYIIEHQIRPDGIINTTETARSTYALAVSYYHERYSKMVVNEQFVSVALMLTDAELKVMEHAVVPTQYKEGEHE
ncbi:MAG: hypothetical protein KBS68_04395 [Clostridiales bacterium]|nr:hypothetical protein [Candidatus Crickella merdequi]